MATIIIKNSSTASSVPTTGDIVEGELAINTVDKKIYSRDDSDNIVELGANYDGRTLTAGNGLTGGGDLSADRSFAVGAGTGITVNANDVELDTSHTDTLYAPLAGDSNPHAVTDGALVDSVQVVNAASSGETQPTDIQVLTESEYGGITPDANTIYFVI